MLLSRKQRPAPAAEVDSREFGQDRRKRAGKLGKHFSTGACCIWDYQGLSAAGQIEETPPISRRGWFWISQQWRSVAGFPKITLIRHDPQGHHLRPFWFPVEGRTPGRGRDTPPGSLRIPFQNGISSPCSAGLVARLAGFSIAPPLSALPSSMCSSLRNGRGAISVAIVAVLVLLFAGFQLSFDADLAALLQVLLGHVHEGFVVDRQGMPFRAVLALAGGLVFPALGRGDAQVRDLAAVLEALDFRVLAQIADEDDLVDRPVSLTP